MSQPVGPLSLSAQQPLFSVPAGKPVVETHSALCPPWDSNPHWNVFETFSSTGWDRGAGLPRLGRVVVPVPRSTRGLGLEPMAGPGLARFRTLSGLPAKADRYRSPLVNFHHRAECSLFVPIRRWNQAFRACA